MLDQKNSKKLWNDFANNFLAEPNAAETIKFEEFKQQMKKLRAKINERM